MRVDVEEGGRDVEARRRETRARVGHAAALDRLFNRRHSAVGAGSRRLRLQGWETQRLAPVLTPNTKFSVRIYGP
mgnify:CR=1 FL=1